GAGSGFSSSTAAWAMSGKPITQLTNLQGNDLVIHGLFTGSIQGLQTVEQSVPLTFTKASGAPGGLTDGYVTNSPTIGFSDASGGATPFPATGNFVEENVCIQPFVIVKSSSTSTLMTNLTYVTWEQFEYGIPAGRIPLSAWTGRVADTNSFVYIYERTKDS